MRKYIILLIMFSLVFGQSGDNRNATPISSFYKSWLQLTGTSNDTIVSSATRVQDGAGYYAPFSLGTDTLKVDKFLKYEYGLITRTRTSSASLDTLHNTDFAIITTRSASGAGTIDLDAAAIERGRIYLVIDGGGNASVNNITITTEGASTINGSASFVLDDSYAWVIVISNGTNWLATKFQIAY